MAFAVGGNEYCAVVGAHMATLIPNDCASRIDYSEVRRRVGNAFAEKASEIADAVETVQGLSKEATRQFQGAVGPHDITPF